MALKQHVKVGPVVKMHAGEQATLEPKPHPDAAWLCNHDCDHWNQGLFELHGSSMEVMLRSHGSADDCSRQVLAALP